MNTDKILEIARRLALHQWVLCDGGTVTYWEFGEEELLAFAQSVIEAERESSDGPYAWVAIHDHSGFDALYFDKQEAIDDGHSFVEPLYRRLQPNARMTNEEIRLIVRNVVSDVTASELVLFYAVARAIEEKIGEKAK